MNVFSCLLLLQQAGNMYFFSGAKLRRYFESRGVKRITCLWRLCYKAVLYVTDIFQIQVSQVQELKKLKELSLPTVAEELRQ